MKTKYAIEIDILGEMYRYATTRLVLDVGSGCGDQSKVSFTPWLQKADGLEASLDLTNKSVPIPSTKVDIYDPDMQLMSKIDLIDIEEVGCRFYEITGDSVIAFYGYLTDLSYNGSTIGLTIRASDSATPLDNVSTLFSYDSFQSFEVLSPRDIQLEMEYTINEDVPWGVYRSQICRSSVGNHTKILSPISPFPTLIKATPGGHVHPDVFYIKTTNELNVYEDYDMDLIDVDSDEEGGDPEPEYVLVPTLKPLFENPNGAYYAMAVIGEGGVSHVEGGKGNQEVIKYAYARLGELWDPRTSSFVTGESVIYLSGIPTAAYPDPINFYGGNPVEEANLVEKFSVKHDHKRKSIIAPYGKFDYLFVKANGFVPNSINDPEIGLGLIDTGREVFNPIDNNTYTTFCRYKITDVFSDVYNKDSGDSKTIDHLLKLQIHSRPVDSNHVYVTYSPNELQKDLDEDHPLRIATFDFIVHYMDLHLINLDEELYGDLKVFVNTPLGEAFRDRYRGLRVDMFNSFSNFLETLQSNQSTGVQQAITQTNTSLLNNANGKFAVCTKSEIITVETGVFETEIYERLYFAVPATALSDFSLVGANVSDDSVDETGMPNIDDSNQSRNEMFVNYLKVHHDAMEIADWGSSFDYQGNKAKDYFLKNKFRVIHDPVPENSSDLGKMFPICYGNLVNVPILQCVSKKVFGHSEGTAGDDYYVYASHRCAISRAADITLRVFSEIKDASGNLKPIDRKDFSNIGATEILENPFPNYVDGHFVMSGNTFRSQGRLMYPYARLENKTTLHGQQTYGLRLQGAKWNSKVGRFDKRYAIRNGIGSSVLYGSFKGYKNENNVFITHPVDVVKHYIKTYSNGAYSGVTFDEDSLNYVKSKTPKYEVSIYMTEPLGVDQFISKIGEQFGLFIFQDKGRVNFAIPNLNGVDFNNPILENLNLLEGTTLSSKGYKTTYNEIEYNYCFDYPNNSYRHSIRLDKYNDSNCAKSSRSRGDVKTFKVDADWVRSSIVANEVAKRYSKIVAGGSKTYECSLKWVDGIDHNVGQVVPMTCEQHGLNESPVLIMSKKTNANGYSLSVIKLT